MTEARHRGAALRSLVCVTLLAGPAGCSEAPEGDAGGPPGTAASAVSSSSDSSPRARPLTDRVFARTPERLERGRYLAEGILECVLCHTERDTVRPGYPPREDRTMAGRVLWERDGYRLVAPNLTPDTATGAGAWPDDALARAIREGVGHDGRALAGKMDWEGYRVLSDEEVAALVVWLRSLPPIRHELPPRRLPPERLAELAGEPEPLTRPVPEPTFAGPVERGERLVRLAACGGCHTNWYVDPMPGRFAGGNEVGPAGEPVFSSNLTPDVSGLGGWSRKQFLRVMRTGKGGTLHPVMPWVAYRHMTDRDLGAIYLALRTLPPVRHWVGNVGEPTYCPLCQVDHPLGAHNERLRIEAASVGRAVLAGYTGRYVSRRRGDTLTVRFADDGGLELVAREDESVAMVPASSTRFRVPDLDAGAVLEAVRDESGALSHFELELGLTEDRLEPVDR